MERNCGGITYLVHNERGLPQIPPQIVADTLSCRARWPLHQAKTEGGQWVATLAIVQVAIREPMFGGPQNVGSHRQRAIVATPVGKMCFRETKTKSLEDLSISASIIDYMKDLARMALLEMVETELGMVWE